MDRKVREVHKYISVASDGTKEVWQDVKSFCWYCGFSFGVFYDYGSDLWVCQECFREQIRDVYGSVEGPDDTKNESRDIAKVDTTKELDTPR